MKPSRAAVIGLVLLMGAAVVSNIQAYQVSQRASKIAASNVALAATVANLVKTVGALQAQLTAAQARGDTVAAEAVGKLQATIAAELETITRQLRNLQAGRPVVVSRSSTQTPPTSTATPSPTRPSGPTSAPSSPAVSTVPTSIVSHCLRLLVLSLC